MRRALIFTAMMLFVTSAFAAWKEQVSTDRMTGEKRVQMETSALAPIRNYGGMIVPKLVLQCLKPSDGTAPYIGAFIVFGESVAVIPDAMMRLRIDDEQVEKRIVGTLPGRPYIQIVVPQTFVTDRLPNSSRVRVEMPLLDGNAFMEFNTKGTQAAINKAGCPMQLNPH